MGEVIDISQQLRRRRREREREAVQELRLLLQVLRSTYAIRAAVGSSSTRGRAAREFGLWRLRVRIWQRELRLRTAAER